MATKVVGSAGRFGSRYGLRLRSKVAKVEKEQKALQECPYCLKKSVKRVAVGIWYCKKCKSKFSGSAYRIRNAIMGE